MNDIKKHIEELRDAKASCSEATLIGIARGIDAKMPEEKLLAAIASGLRGGIGGTHSDGTCGALTAGVIALGLLNPGDGAKATRLSRILFNEFKERFGAVECNKIAKNGNRSNCSECCLKAGECVGRLNSESKDQ